MQEENFVERWVRRLFGANSKQAKKQFFNSRTSYFINKGAVQIETDVPYELYKNPLLRIPIDKGASMFSNGRFMLEDIKTGKKEVLPPDLAKLLENPNILQSQNAFLKKVFKHYNVYGNCFIKKNKPSFSQTYPTSLQVPSPAYTKPVLTGKVFDQTDIKKIIEKFEYIENGVVKPFKTEEVLWIKIDDLDNDLLGVSPLKALQYPLSNSEYAYKYLNAISAEKGAIGIFSNNTKDAMGALPMDEQEKKDIEQAYRSENGLDDNQKKVHVTSSTVSWTPMSYPTKDLLLLEQLDAYFITILNAYSINRNLFDNSTYENLRHGLVQTHNDAIVPFADEFTQSIGTFIGNIPQGKKLVLDYSHLPYLQTDKLSEANTFESVSRALSALVTSQVIDNAQANNILLNQFGIKTKA